MPRNIRLAILVLALGACSQGEEGRANAQGRDGMMGMMGDRGGMMGGAMGDMATIRGLLAQHEDVERQVEDVPGGVRTVTTSSDPRVAALIREHVRDMADRWERGQPIRMRDPVFRELFRTRHLAEMEIEDVPGGVRVLHRSDDPRVAALIRQHARHFVSEAAEEGMRRAMRPTPLPGGYSRPERQEARQ